MILFRGLFCVMKKMNVRLKSQICSNVPKIFYVFWMLDFVSSNVIEFAEYCEIYKAQMLTNGWCSAGIAGTEKHVIEQNYALWVLNVRVFF